MSSQNAWISVRDMLPRDCVEVETKIDDADGTRNIQTLTLRNRMWWFPDFSMYVYYAPTHWRTTQ